MSVRRAATVALIAAVAWALLIVVTGWRLGWLTPAIGLAVGGSIRVATKPAATLALVLTLTAIVLGRGCASVGARWHVSGHELKLEPTLVYDAVAAELYPPDAPADDPYNPQPNAFEKMVRVQERVSKMSDGEHRAAVRRYLGTTDVPVVRTSPARGFFRWPDLLWWPAALWIAWRLNAPKPEQRSLGLVETSVAEFERQQREKFRK